MNNICSSLLQAYWELEKRDFLANYKALGKTLYNEAARLPWSWFGECQKVEGVLENRTGKGGGRSGERGWKEGTADGKSRRRIKSLFVLGFEPRLLRPQRRVLTTRLHEHLILPYPLTTLSTWSWYWSWFQFLTICFELICLSRSLSFFQKT